MRLLLLAALLVPSACAQPADRVPKPSTTGDDGLRDRRADSVITAPAAAERAVATDTLTLTIGETRVTVVVHTAPAPGGGPGRLDALNVHDDEDTSVEAALAVIARRGGRVVELRHTGERLLAFRLGGERFTVDPNRIFTDRGRARTLAALSRDTPAARRAVAAFADTLLAVYTSTRPDPVVTLHNNTDTNYSAESYGPRGEYRRDAAAVAVPAGSDPDDFYFVTGEWLYDALVPSGFGVVRQNDAAATDDGSLSVWAARAGVPYVNVEAQHGHREVQTRMLDALADVLADR